MNPVFILLTCANAKEATAISSELLQQKLVACAQQLPTDSLYWWKGKITSDSEVVLHLETLDSKFELIEQVVKKMHSYEQPVMLQIPLTKTSRGTLEWIKESTHGNNS